MILGLSQLFFSRQHWQEGNAKCRLDTTTTIYFYYIYSGLKVPDYFFSFKCLENPWKSTWSLKVLEKWPKGPRKILQFVNQLSSYRNAVACPHFKVIDSMILIVITELQLACYSLLYAWKTAVRLDLWVHCVLVYIAKCDLYLLCKLHSNES